MIAPKQCKVGQTVTFEGYADDYGRHIVAVEFTFDDWKTVARYDTSESNPDLMIHWTYAYTPTQPGIYQLKVRSVTEDGRVSPIAAEATLYVEE